MAESFKSSLKHLLKVEIVCSTKDLQDLNLKKDDVVICGIPVNNYQANYKTIKTLIEKRVKVYFVLDHWHNSYKNFYDIENNKKYFPEKIFCIDHFMKSSLAEGGISSDKISAVGQPALEGTYTNRNNLSKPDSMQKYLNTGKTVVCLFLDPIGKRRNQIGYNELDVVKETIKAIGKKQDEFLLIIKCHPRGDISLIKKEVFKKENVILVDESENCDALDLVKISDFVLGMTSIMLIHAMVLGKKTASIQITPTEEGKKRSNPYLDNAICESFIDISDFISNKSQQKNDIPSCIFKDVSLRIYEEIISSDNIHSPD